MPEGLPLSPRLVGPIPPPLRQARVGDVVVVVLETVVGARVEWVEWVTGRLLTADPSTPGTPEPDVVVVGVEVLHVEGVKLVVDEAERQPLSRRVDDVVVYLVPGARVQSTVAARGEYLHVVVPVEAPGGAVVGDVVPPDGGLRLEVRTTRADLIEDAPVPVALDDVLL